MTRLSFQEHRPRATCQLGALHPQKPPVTQHALKLSAPSTGSCMLPALSPPAARLVVHFIAPVLLLPSLGLTYSSISLPWQPPSFMTWVMVSKGRDGYGER